MALLEASPVYHDTRALFGGNNFDEIEPSIEELEAIEAEGVGELTVDPFELMKGYVQSLRGAPFAARDVEQFQPDLDAQERSQFMQRFVRSLVRDEETAELLRIHGNTKGRTYWLASVLSEDAAADGPEWFEAHQNIELETFDITSDEGLEQVQRMLRRLHSLREEGTTELNGVKIKEIFKICNDSIRAYRAHTDAITHGQIIRHISSSRLTSLPPIGDAEVDDYDFTDYANCRGLDPDLFFPERGASIKEAQAVCQGCVVREECLEYALETKQLHGIWGGASERERRRIRRQRKLNEQLTPVTLAD